MPSHESRDAVPSHESRVTIHDSRFTVWVIAVVLTIIYAATLAPGVTLWDSGEFQAAAASLGIPHPPGTPLYILLANAWATVLGALPLALAVNLLSAVATAIACGLLAGLMARWLQDRLAGLAAGLSAGSMLAVWQNATETEIYAVSMLLGVLMVVAGDRAGRRDSARSRLLLAYLMGLAVPIQISALVAAPAAILLAATGPDRTRPDWRHLATLGAVLLAVIGASLGSVTVFLLGGTGLVWSAFGRRHGPYSRLEPAGLAIVAALGMSATLFMLVRAAHDPLINQGNPSTFDAMLDVVWRRQYPLPGLWPRQSPIWVQLLTLIQYADWQVASGLDNSVAASWWRTPWSLAALLLAVAGARWQFRLDPRGARGTAILLLAASLGVVGVLNLRAGPSIIDAVLPPGALHEPRERDYFFALAFATAGVWVGAGAVVLSRRLLAGRSSQLVATAALAVAAIPVAFNWRAANRRPDGMLATTLGESLLASSPPDAVLLVAGDNDTYTTWYRQSALGERRDVVPVTISLLPAVWYRRELSRRYRLLDSATVTRWRGDLATLQALAEGARREGRPLAAAVTVSRSLRTQLAPAWTLGGMAFVADGGAPRGDRVDTAVTRSVAGLIEHRRLGEPAGRDPAAGYVWRILRCPGAALQLGTPTEPAEALLDSRCNFK